MRQKAVGCKCREWGTESTTAVLSDPCFAKTAAVMGLLLPGRGSESLSTAKERKKKNM